MNKIVNLKDFGNVAALNAAFGAGNWTYVGRASQRYGVSTSALANPYKIGRDGNRNEVIAQYRQWLWRKIKAADRAVVAALLDIKPDTVLVCWCAPKRCHSEVVAQAVTWLNAQRHIYVGVKPNGAMETFRATASELDILEAESLETLEQGTYRYGAVIGPFHTTSGAQFMAAYGAHNPHCRTVADAERLAQEAEPGVAPQASSQRRSPCTSMIFKP